MWTANSDTRCHAVGEGKQEEAMAEAPLGSLSDSLSDSENMYGLKRSVCFSG